MHINQIAQKQAGLRKAKQTLIRDIMTTKVATVTPDTSLRDAARMLLDLRISGLPVVNAGNELVGIVAEADFLRAMDIPCHHPTHSLWQMLEVVFRHHPEPGKINVRVVDIMSKHVITVSESETLHDAIDKMKKNHIKRVVVANEERQVQGIITRSNLMQVLLQKILD